MREKPHDGRHRPRRHPAKIQPGRLASEAVSRGKYEAGVDYWNQIIARLGDDSALIGQENWVVIERSGNIALAARRDKLLSTQKTMVAAALTARGILQGMLGRSEEELASYAELVDHFSMEEQPELQKMVADSIARTLTRGNPDAATRLYATWYRSIPTMNLEILGRFQSVTLLLHVSGVPTARLLEILESAPTRSEQMRPLIVALRLEMGEKVRAPTEILEVAADVRKQIQKLRQSLKQGSPPDNGAETPAPVR